MADEHQYNPRLQRVTRGADAVEASMQYLWGCGSRGRVLADIWKQGVQIEVS